MRFYLGCSLEKGVGFTWVTAEIPKALAGRIEIRFAPAAPTKSAVIEATLGHPVRIELPNQPIAEYLDPQGLLADARTDNGALSGRIIADPGPGVLFVSDGNREAPRWQPVSLDIHPATPVAKRTWNPPGPEDRTLDKWVLVDLSRVFNAEISKIMQQIADNTPPPPLPTSQVGFSYWKEHMVVRCKPACDTAWRAKIGPDSVAWTTDGIPFKTAKTGPDIAVACLQNKTFPPSLSVPVKASGRRLYLMIGGVTWPAQSHVVNLRITLHFADGSAQQHDLVQPRDIGNCWGTWCGLCFDTPGNGFENIGGRSGPAGTAAVADLTRPVAVDTIAQLIGYDLPANVQLDRVDLAIIANDVAFGFMGVSVLK